MELPAESRFCLHCGKRVARRSSGAHGAMPERLQRALGDEYKVGAEIGRGGFAIVYSVQDLRLDRGLAVKVIRPEFVAADVIVARFRREAKIVAQLKHQNVLGITFAGEGEGLVYCAMPLIAGDTLRERVKRLGKLSVEKALRVFGEIANGLEHAHGKGIIHRDVKPANVMLDHDADDRAILLDFGIAKSLAPVGSKLSVSGQVVGSPDYMSPERLAGAKTIDARADIYSMGVVAFQMLVGRLPFRRDAAPQPNISPVQYEPPDVRSIRPDVPASFARAVERCMQFSPDDRWSSALEASNAAGATGPTAD